MAMMRRRCDLSHLLFGPPVPAVTMDSLRGAIGDALRSVCERLPRPLSIAEPCVGMGGYREMMALSGCTYRAVNVFDVESKLSQYYQGLASLGQVVDANGSFGSNCGDIEKVDLDSLLFADGLVAGPPCGPWASNGLRHGGNDERSKVFDTVVKWVGSLGNEGTLALLRLGEQHEHRHQVSRGGGILCGGVDAAIRGAIAGFHGGDGESFFDGLPAPFSVEVVDSRLQTRTFARCSSLAVADPSFRTRAGAA